MIRAALWALTAENISGWAKAKRSAPYPPMETPVMARPFRPGRTRYLLSMYGNEFLQKEIAIAESIARRIDVETALALRGHYEKVIDLVLAAEIFDYAPSAGAEQRLLVLAKAVEEVENGITSRAETLWRHSWAAVAHSSGPPV